MAPMKALASEIVEKLGKRLAWLEIEVRELTGIITWPQPFCVCTEWYKGTCI